MRISDWSSDVCSSDLALFRQDASRYRWCGRHADVHTVVHGLGCGRLVRRQRALHAARQWLQPVRQGLRCRDQQERLPLHAGCVRSEEHTSELQSLMRISYAVFCLKKKQYKHTTTNESTTNKIRSQT